MITHTDYMMAGDLKELVEENPDYSFDSPELKYKAYTFNEDLVCQIQQEIDSKVKIKSIIPVTHENIETL